MGESELGSSPPSLSSPSPVEEATTSGFSFLWAQKPLSPLSLLFFFPGCVRDGWSRAHRAAVGRPHLRLGLVEVPLLLHFSPRWSYALVPSFPFGSEVTRVHSVATESSSGRDHLLYALSPSYAPPSSSSKPCRVPKPRSHPSSLPCRRDPLSQCFSSVLPRAVV